LQRIDQAVQAILAEAFDRTIALLARHRALLDRCARELLARETLDEAALAALTQELRVDGQGSASR
jgi:cell division protease FtsH